MKSTPRRRRRRLIPEVHSLESRRLLTAVVTCLGQDGEDIVGPDASQGPDGIQDLELQLTNLSGTVSAISITAPGGFEWAAEPDPTGAALAEYFPSTTAGQGDVYINPQVKSDLPPAGGTLPLGGSTGSLIDLTNGTPLTVTIDYQGSSTPDVVTVPVSNLVSATDPMPATPVPANVLGTFQVQDLGQDGTGQSYEQGFVHLVVTAPSGITFDSATFSQVTWTLSDQFSNEWDSTSSTLGHNHIYATLRSGSSNVVDLYFPPLANEAPPSGSSASTMLLQVTLPGSSQVYATPFAGTDANLALMTEPINTEAPPAPPTTEAQLRADLMSTSPEYDTIDLPADQTIVITQPLEITHSVQIVGNGATLYFQQGDTAAWPASASGAIYVSDPGGTNIQVELDDFTIKFDMSQPIRWSNPSGTSPALWDPENNQGIVHAVIDTQDSNSNENRDVLTLSGMSIYGPPAFDGSTYAGLQQDLVQSGDTTHEYVGEQAIDLIRANDQDSGTITDSTFQGGPIEVFGGPWTITDNTVLGAMADTYSPGAFELHSAFDALIEGNQVTQSDAAGSEFRLVVLANSGYDDTIQGNTFGGGAGQIGDEMTYDSGSDQFNGINSPEVILAESSYTVLFEGRPAAISADGRLLVLTDLRTGAAAEVTGPGMVVSILAGVNADGSSNMTLAGQWYPVAQQASLSGNTIELLMQDPLPAPPPGGYYIVEVTGGFENNVISGNTLDLTGKSSTGIKLDGEDYGTTITGNHFIGGTIYNNGYNGTAIYLGAGISSASSSGGDFPLPWGWTALPSLGATIEDNTIQDSLGGIQILVEHQVDYWTSTVTSASEEGRVFVTATVKDNTFEFDSAFLQAWSSEYVAQGNDPSQSSTPPTITLGAGWSSEAPGPYASPRFPWTVGGAMTLFGADSPIFVDPTELDVNVSGNATELIAADGTATVQSGLSGQVYAATVNGVVMAPTVATQTYNGLPYWPLNLDNLDIAGSSSPTPTPTPSPTPTPTPSPTPTPTPTPTPSPTPTPTPSPTPTPTPTPTPDPPSGSAPPTPTNLTVIAVGPSQIDLAWDPSPGATGYVVERSDDGGMWVIIARGVTTPSYADTGLADATTYQYAVMATSGDGYSQPSATASATTGPVTDALSIQPLVITATRRQPFSGDVATFTDPNALATSGSFIAVIHWGDGDTSRGTVTGSDGQFTVVGRHRYAAAGRYAVRVTVTMSAPSRASTKTTSIAAVAGPLRVIKRAAKARRAR
jgi:hypothetical protein